MRSLFVKIFLYFLLIILLVSSLVVAMTYLRNQEFPPLANQNFARRAIVEYGLEALAEWQKEGASGLTEYIEELRRKTGILLVLFDAQGRPLSTKRFHRRMQHMALRALRSGEVVFPPMGGRNGLASTMQSPDGKTYVVALSLPDRPLRRHAFQALTHGFLGWQLLLLLAIAALVCFFLARSLSRPIVQLRRATRRFADGDLTTRIADQVKGRNELAGLATDFDHMAGKIEEQVQMQQRLLRDISHELRSPLTRLGIALEMLRQGQSPTQDKALDRIEREAERMNTLIGQLLGLTRLESGAAEIHFEMVALDQLVAQLVKDADFEAETRQCRVILRTAGAAEVRADRELLQQALENVIRNGIKYSAPGTEVEVHLSRSGQQYQIQVSDRGPGVPEEALDKLFIPFYRVGDARDRQSGGSGIGLAIAERSIKLHQGTIKANNRPEGGLQMTIRLPVSANR
jgi:two-component system sensor histidine kinase CpxA